jgi:hypothetical protein
VEGQFDHEAILQGAPQAFDAALGLGGVGRDVPDAELPEYLAEVGGMLGALELFLETPVAIIADEDAEAVAVGSRASRSAPRPRRAG